MMHQPKPIRKKKNRYAIILFTYILIALLAPILANEKPLLLTIHGNTSFPAFSNDPYTLLPDAKGVLRRVLSTGVDWKNLKAETIIFPPVAWSPLKSDMVNSFVSPFDEQYRYDQELKSTLPFRYRHFLGTGKTGNDVLAGLIHGCRTSMLIGFLSIAIAMFLGIFLGGISGYFGDNKLKIKRGGFMLSLFLLIPSWFYAFHLRGDIIKTGFSESLLSGSIQLIVSFIIFFGIVLWPLLLKFSSSSFFGKKINFPIDHLLSRFTEIFLSIPRLILILAIAAIVKPSVISIIFIIGITSWTESARIIRARFLSLREMNFITSAKAMGNPSFRILLIHLLPNVLSQITVIGIFGIAAAILIETGLSFLGAGVPADTATWGSLLFQARENYQAWWLVVFSGTAIFLLMTSLFMLGNSFKSSQNKSSVFNKF